jgi:hypothetical protein
MPKVTYSAVKGLVQEAGSGISLTSDSIVFSSLPTSTVQAIAASSAVTAPGVYTLSGSAGAIGATLPVPSDVPGGTFIFRSTSASAHFLTGSTASAGVNIFAGMAGATPANVGQKLAFPAVIGSSVTLVSDGLSYCFSAASGTMTISTP